MRKLYPVLITSLVLFCLIPHTGLGQCGTLSGTATPQESRCMATGFITVTASGGSGNYKYKAVGPVNTSFTSADSITGLPPGNYSVTITDITSNCSIVIAGVVVTGTYQDPRFTLNKEDVSCDNGNNGSISVGTQNFGRAPFMYSIIAPSPTGVGTSNATGTFTGLSAGLYTIRLTDSCGGIQTRLVNVNNYTWKIDSVRFRKISCDSATGYIRVSDNRGNISTITGLPGFTYGIVRSAGDTIWSGSPSFTFYLGSQNNFEAVVKDPCGTIKKFPVVVSFKPSVNASVNTYGFSCRQFSVNLTGISNFLSPRFCITDSAGAEVACNSSGNFTSLDYGSYCIAAYDSCSDTTITRCFTVLPPLAGANENILVTNKVCSGFTASVTGQTGLSNPEYCLYDSLNNIVACNTTGVFDSLTYGNYCINITDTCRDTTMQRCFSVRKPVPVINPPEPGFYTCTNFGITVTGDSLTNPRFCLYDTAGVLINCNYTGVFDSVVYGDYCIQVYDSCYDTTIIRCISVAGPELIYSLSSEISNRACSTFTATIFSSSFIAPDYCLYRMDSTLVACNNDGIFDSLTYGSYFINARNACPDTTVTYYVDAYPPLPSLDAGVNISNRSCSGFSVSTSGQYNFSNPQYCLYNSNDSLLACNTSGSFTGLAYDSYCIKATDGCYDTVVTRCFSAQPAVIDMEVSSSKSCSYYGSAVLNISIAGGVVPYIIQILNPDGTSYSTAAYNNSNIRIDNVPDIADSLQYMIIVTDNCGGTDSVFSGVTPSVVSHNATVIPRCPSSTWLNGSGTIQAAGVSNTGSVTVRIVKKDNANVSITPNNVAAGISTFNNLGPGTYIIRYRINDACKSNLYDTVVIPIYHYPSLDRSSAYQCDEGGFSIGAVVLNGVGPFMYEIIGSSPTVPAIISGPQANPVFTINNGAAYSLIRLRVTDACGNASLEDASILPLANNGIMADFNCFQLHSTLRVDTLYNSVYAWYKKNTVNGADSTYMGSSYGLYFPNVLPEDTGLYVCYINVNSGCIKRTYYYRLDGSCYGYLPITLQRFDGAYFEKDVLLNWQMAANTDVKYFTIEKKIGNTFKPAGRLNAGVDMLPGTSYSFKDIQADPLSNYYRLKITRYNNLVEYSNVIHVSQEKKPAAITVYPNPADDLITVQFNSQSGGPYTITLLNMMNQVVNQQAVTGQSIRQVTLGWPEELAAGIYIIKVEDKYGKKLLAQKIVLR
ncbi:MAG TPA: T9SS type A sorting domain-containing protein [Ferruginibacter sp.]|nr:T9SS type A sorting domain-containing protein [Ferruginibacter sp.]HPH89673.1 T9SS type A sorting domain-containing protein [Ferruginibacter sp.]